MIRMLTSDEDQVRAVLRQLQELQALRDNLASCQGRCGELLEDSRAKQRRIDALEDELEILRMALGKR